MTLIEVSSVAFEFIVALTTSGGTHGAPTAARSVVDPVAGLEDDRCSRRVEADTDRIASGGDFVHLLPQQPTQQNDALVAGGQPLLGVQRDRPLANLRLQVARKIAALFRRHVLPGSAVGRSAHSLGQKDTVPSNPACGKNAVVRIVD